MAHCSAMPDLIIHADDYGLTGSVSEGILEAHAYGVVTSTSILMTHVTSRELLWLRADPTLDVGIHLNLTAGVPVSGVSPLPTLTQERRTFTVPRIADAGSPHKHFDFSAVPDAELLTELEAQVQAGLQTGLPISHLDTHHHIHRDPRIFVMVLALASREGLGVRTLSPEQRQQCVDVGIPTTHAFLGDWFGDASSLSREALLEAVSRLGADQLGELMCHPGKNSETLEALSSYAATRELELELLQDPGLRRALRNAQVRLISWRDL